MFGVHPRERKPQEWTARTSRAPHCTLTPMADIQALVASMREHGDFREVQPHDPLPACITYAVVQGTDILTIGSGGRRRLETLMGGRGQHNKAALIGIARMCRPDSPLRFCVCRYTGSKTPSLEEVALGARFGKTDVGEAKSCSAAIARLEGRFRQILDDRFEPAERLVADILLDLMKVSGDVVAHAVSTPSAGAIVEKMFDGYWPSRVVARS
jgi:hypothetical protein